MTCHYTTFPIYSRSYRFLNTNTSAFSSLPLLRFKVKSATKHLALVIKTIRKRKLLPGCFLMLSFLNTLQSLNSIQYINLDGNRLKRLHPNLFSNLPSLVHLILSSNPFQLDRTRLILSARTQFIDISSVGLDHIPPAMFGYANWENCTTTATHA